MENVSYKEMAKRLQVNPSTIARLIDRFGERLAITVKTGRANTTNKKWSHFLCREDADKLITFYESGRAGTEPQPDDDNVFQQFGVFYVIQLVPEALPNRIKIGYTDNLAQRLAAHQTAAPTARVVCSWPCKRAWDHAAMDSITREGCEWVLNEVFEGDPAGFVERGNAFFAVMPKPTDSCPISVHSPMKVNALLGNTAM